MCVCCNCCIYWMENGFESCDREKSRKIFISHCCELVKENFDWNGRGGGLVVDDVTFGVDSQPTIPVTDSPLGVMDVVRCFQVPEDPSIHPIRRLFAVKRFNLVWFFFLFFSQCRWEVWHIYLFIIWRIQGGGSCVGWLLFFFFFQGKQHNIHSLPRKY